MYTCPALTPDRPEEKTGETMEIHLPPNYKPRKPSNGNGYQGYRPKDCYAQKVSIDLRQEHQKKIYSKPAFQMLNPVCPPYFPVCPMLQEIIKQEKRYRPSNIPKTNFPLLDSIIKILFVFNDLTQLKPNRETVVRWAHNADLLKERLDLIRNDLSALPQWLEKDYPKSSEECKELVAAVQLAEMQYVMDGQSFVYLLPNDLEFGNWATFSKWREQQINLANFSENSLSVRIEMCHITRHYPADVIKAMHALGGLLSPLVKILSEKAKADLANKQEATDNKKQRGKNDGFELSDSDIQRTIEQVENLKRAKENYHKARAAIEKRNCPEEREQTWLEYVQPAVDAVLETFKKLNLYYYIVHYGTGTWKSVNAIKTILGINCAGSDPDSDEIGHKAIIKELETVKINISRADITSKPNDALQPESQNGEIFYGLTWDEPLTPKTIKYIEDTFGPLAKNLNELAGLVRESRDKYMKAGQVSRDDARWIEVEENARLMVSVDKWGILIRTFASAKLLRPVIELAAGSEQQARRFYEAIVTAISGHDFRFSKIMSSAVLSSESRGENQVKEVSNFQADLFSQMLSDAKKCDAETITKTLEAWHNNNLLIHYGKRQGGKAGDEKPSTNNDTGWVFKTGQVLYNNVDLDIAGFRLDILKRLVDADGGVITHNELRGITERYKHYIGELRNILAKKNIPCTIKTVSGEGYKLTAY